MRRRLAYWLRHRSKTAFTTTFGGLLAGVLNLFRRVPEEAADKQLRSREP